MKKITLLYYRWRRRQKLSEVVLPTELFTFPLGLTLAVALPARQAWLWTLVGLVLGALLVYLVGGMRRNRSGVLRSFAVLGLWGLLLHLDPRGEGACTLVLQGLLLISYLLSSLLVAGYRGGRRLWRRSPPQLCVRGRVLRAERLRFERILVLFSLLSLLFIGLWIQLCPEHFRGLFFWVSCFIAAFTWGVYALETTHLVWVVRQLSREAFIPVLDDNQLPIGRVSKSDARTLQGRLPVVRLVATSRSMIYLQSLPATSSLPQAEGYDTPFSSWLTEGWTPEQLAQRMIDERFCGIRRARPRFLLHYHAQIAGQGVSVFLFGVAIEDPSQLYIDCLPQQGRWWPVEHLLAPCEHAHLSPYLLTEYPYLEQTLLLAERLRSAAPPTTSTDE